MGNSNKSNVPELKGGETVGERTSGGGAGVCSVYDGDGDEQLLFARGTRHGQRGRRDVPQVQQGHGVSDEARVGGGNLLLLDQDGGRARLHLQVKVRREEFNTHTLILNLKKSLN